MKESPESKRQYFKLLKKLDSWSRGIHDKYADQIVCGRGCARCCHGLFDVSQFDALQLIEGFKSLPAAAQASVARRASTIHKSLVQEQPNLRPPYFLNSLPPERIDQLVDFVGEVGCPFLDTGDACLVYHFRPVTCRIEGIPMIDLCDGPFSDWCELNFKQGVSSEAELDLKLDYYEIQGIEKDTAIFIPSVVHAVVNGEWEE